MAENKVKGLVLGYPSPIYMRGEPAYKEGKTAFENGLSHTENPYKGKYPDHAGWRWADGWLDAMAERVRR